MSDGRPFSNCILDLAPPDIAWFQGALGHHPGPDRLLRAARRAPADRHGHDHGAGGLAPRGREGRRAVHAAVLGRLLAAAHARDRVRASARSRCAPRRSTRVLYDILRSLIHHGWNKLILVNGHGSNARCIDPLLRRIKYETGALVALYKPYAERYIGHPRRAAGEPARGDARLARVASSRPRR